MVTVLNQVANAVVETKKMIKTMSVEINKIHKILGHFGESHFKGTANAYRIKVYGKLEAYESCAISMEKKKKTNQIWIGSSKVPGERLCFNISLIKYEICGEAKFWALILDDYTDCMEVGNGTYIFLKKIIYGLVQSAR
jgi:hypothetical protein